MKSSDPYSSRDPAATVAPGRLLLDGPAGVPTLEQAAALLQAPLSEVSKAAKNLTPWPSDLSPTGAYWSLRQLARHVAKTRFRRRYINRGRLALSYEQAEEAADLAAEGGARLAAVKFNVVATTLYRTWMAYGIPAPTGQQRRGPRTCTGA